MSAIAFQTNVTRLNVVESIEQDTHPASVNLTAPLIVKLDNDGKWTAAAAADTGTYLLLSSVKEGMPATALKQGVVDGLALSALAYGAPLYSHASGIPDTTTSTNEQVIGNVISSHSNLRGAAADKLLRVNMP